MFELEPFKNSTLSTSYSCSSMFNILDVQRSYWWDLGYCILHLQWGYVAAIVCKQARNYMFEGYQGSPGLYQPLPCRQQHAWTPRVPNDQRSGGDYRSFGARLCQRRRRGRDDWFGWLVLAWWGFIGVAVSKGFCWWCFCEVCPCIAIYCYSSSQ